MMTSPTELCFDCKPNVSSVLLKSYGEHAAEQIQNLEEFVARLEEEKLKIDAFKRELPLCMQLLTDAMEVSRRELQSQRTSQGARPVLEEFIPLKTTTSAENAANISADKADWMTSARLWNQEIEGNSASQSPVATSDPVLALNSQQSISGRGAFGPFSSKDGISEYLELALGSSDRGEIEDSKNSVETVSRGENSGKCNNSSACRAANATQTHRKARRCWSPDLHRRFVNALHMLGGSHVATPKQIRELMKVDGLTNDEVKSHLQTSHKKPKSKATGWAIGSGKWHMVAARICGPWRCNGCHLVWRLEHTPPPPIVLSAEGNSNPHHAIAISTTSLHDSTNKLPPGMCQTQSTLEDEKSETQTTVMKLVQ